MAVEVERLITALEARITGYERELRKASGVANQRARQIETRFQRMNRHMSSSFTAMAATATRALGVLGVGVGGAALTRNIRSVVSEVSELGKQARSIGILSSELQELQFGFGQAGVEANQLNRALEQFSQRLGQAEARGGQLADVLKANGIALRDQNGEMRPVMDLLRDYADLIQRADSQQQALTLSAAAFGDRGGRQMIRALREGSMGMDELMQRARDAGVVIEDSLVDAAERIEDRWDKFTTQMGSFFKRIILMAAEGADIIVEQFRDLEDRTMIRPLMQRLDALSEENRMLTREMQEQQRILEQSGPFGDPAAEGKLAAIRDRLSEIDGEYTSIMARLEALRNRGATGGGGVLFEPEEETESRGRSARATREQRDAAEELIRTLEHELSLVNASMIERDIANNLRLAGAEATEEQRRQIIELTEALLREEEAAMQAAETHRFFGDVAHRSIEDLIVNARSAEDVINNLTRALARAALEAALLGTGPLAGFFGTSSGGGLFGALGFGGARADGGPVGAPVMIT